MLDGRRCGGTDTSGPATSGQPPSAVTMPSVIGVAVRVHSRKGDDLGICHVPPPVDVGDVLDLGRGPILLLRVIGVVETRPGSPLAALVRVVPDPALVR
jgi:hypothetical protein